MKTKFGNARINNMSYYVITSKKEGNGGKLLHRLVFEDYHNCTLDSNDAIHHIDFDKTNNHPNNLICMSRKAHNILHNTNNKYNQGKSLSEETKQKISEAKKRKKLSEEHKIKLSESCNTSGYFRVTKEKNKKYKQGFQVKAKGLEWREI